jgi:hypothetical protein
MVNLLSRALETAAPKPRPDDETGAMAGLPFMPELAAYRGQGFKANRRADKVCDTVMYTGSRFIPGAVLLDDVRCDGSEYSCWHCQAAL